MFGKGPIQDVSYNPANVVITGGSIDNIDNPTDEHGVGDQSHNDGRYRRSKFVADKTDTYNIISADFDRSLRMNSTSDKIFNLPSVGASEDGARVTIQKLAAGKVTIDAADSDKIADSGAGDTIYNNIAAETYASITLEYIHAIVTWVIIGGFGTWTSTD